MASTPNTAQRRTDIDTLRAIACIGLVSYHVVGNSPQSGMELAPDHWLNIINMSLIDLRMPLFSFLSGLVLLTLSRDTKAWLCAAKKARRLMVPMLSVGTLFWGLRDAMGYEQIALLHIVVLPFAHFWFLQATLLIVAVFLALNWALGGRHLAAALIMGGAGAFAHVAGLRPDVNVFSVAMACKLIPFFAAGYLVGQSKLWAAPAQIWLRFCAGAVLGFGVTVGAALALDWITLEGEARRSVGLALGMSFCLALIVLRPRHGGLARIGAYSYSVYLFHVFFTAGSLMVLERVMPGGPSAVIWGGAMMMGLAGPILVQHVIVRNAVLSFFFMGTKLDIPALMRNFGFLRPAPLPAQPVERTVP